MQEALFTACLLVTLRPQSLAMTVSKRWTMKGILGFVLAGSLALLAAWVVVQGEPGSAELHLVNAVTTDGPAGASKGWLSFFVGP